MGCQTVRFAAVNFCAKVSGLRKKMIATPIRFNDMFPRSGLFSPLFGPRASLPIARPNFLPKRESKGTTQPPSSARPCLVTCHDAYSEYCWPFGLRCRAAWSWPSTPLTKLLNNARLTNVHSRPGRQPLADASTRRNERLVEGRDEVTHGLKMYKEDRASRCLLLP